MLLLYKLFNLYFGIFTFYGHTPISKQPRNYKTACPFITKFQVNWVLQGIAWPQILFQWRNSIWEKASNCFVFILTLSIFYPINIMYSKTCYHTFHFILVIAHTWRMAEVVQPYEICTLLLLAILASIYSNELSYTYISSKHF